MLRKCILTNYFYKHINRICFYVILLLNDVHKYTRIVMDIFSENKKIRQKFYKIHTLLKQEMAYARVFIYILLVFFKSLGSAIFLIYEWKHLIIFRNWYYFWYMKEEWHQLYLIITLRLTV